MFIHSKKNFELHFPDGEVIAIQKGFIGKLSDKIASHWMMQAAIRDGSIVATEQANDAAFELAEKDASEREEEHDLRTDEEEEAGKRKKK